jgi:predicted nucleic acid-binding Zn ribbon protein
MKEMVMVNCEIAKSYTEKAINKSGIIFQGTYEMLYDYAFTELESVTNSNIALP